jgi:8-oxo-dGTP pyrophosphatase MutT (NUDIX family)
METRMAAGEALEQARFGSGENESTLPDDVRAPGRAPNIRAKHAASLIVWKIDNGETHMLMGMRGAKHRFMPNRLVFPGGRVEPADMKAPSATVLSPHAEAMLRKNANAALARGLAAAAARELQEETGLSLGTPPRLDVLHYLARAVTPPGAPIRFNARFFAVAAEHVSGTGGGDGELEGLRFYAMTEALGFDLASPTRKVLGRLELWLSMTESERSAETRMPVLIRDQGWRME